MTVYTTNLIFFMVIISLIIVTFSVIITREKNKEVKTKIVKKRRSSKDAKGNLLGGSLAQKFEKNADVSKRFKIETMCMQAGMDLTYGEYKFICTACAIAFPFVILVVLRNIPLALVMALIGYVAPAQYIKTVANKRVKKMEEQCGSFIRIVLERYKTSKDMSSAITNSLHDFFGCEPFYENLRQCVYDIQIGLPCEEALENLARRCGNKFLARFSDYYKITGNLATHESKYELLHNAFVQYEEDRELKQLLKKEISGPVSESYIMVVATPAFMCWQAVANPDYLDFMLNTTTGQVGLAVILVVILLCIIFINAKIAAPID